METRVRNWTENKATVDSRYLGTAFLRSSRAVDLLTVMKQCTERKPVLSNNVIQLSMDDPNLNWKRLKDFSGVIRFAECW